MRRALLGSLTSVALLAAAPAIAGDVPPQAAGADTSAHVDPVSKTGEDPRRAAFGCGSL